MEAVRARALILRIQQHEDQEGEKSFFEINFDTLQQRGVGVADIVEALELVPTIDHVKICFDEHFPQADTRRLLDFIQSRNSLVKLSLGAFRRHYRQVFARYIGSALSNQSLQTLRFCFCQVSVHQLVHILRVGCPVRNLEFTRVCFEKNAEHDLDTLLIGGSNKLEKLSFDDCTFGSRGPTHFEVDRESFNIFDSCWKDPSVRKPAVEIVQMSGRISDFPFGATIGSSVKILCLKADCDPASLGTILAAGKKIEILSVELGTSVSDYTVGQQPGWTVDAKCNHLANAIPDMALQELNVTILPTCFIDKQGWKRQVRRLMKAIAKNVSIKTIKLTDEGNLLTEKEKQEFEGGLDFVVASLDRKLVPDLLGLFGQHGSSSALFKTNRVSAEAGDNGIFRLLKGRRAPPTDGA